MEKKTFVICRMYAGSYITSKMGGEIINLLHDDNGNNYIYVNPYGYIDKTYDNTVKAVLLTRLYKSGCFEVLGVAKIGEKGQLVFPKGYTTKEKLKSTGEQLVEKEKMFNIKYGGIKLSDIYKGQLNGSVTFKSEKLLLPKKQLFITDSQNTEFNDCENVYNLKDKRFPNQSLISYITYESNPDSFSKVEEMINNSNLWETDKKNVVSDNQEVDTHFNFLNIIKKEDDELAYSNMFQYFFTKYPNLLKSFAREILSVELSDDVLIEREKENIDIFIQDKNNIIVIENKIKSGINGIGSRHDFSESGLIQSQLSKYHQYVESIKESRKTNYFIFLPVYNKVNIKLYSGSRYYKEITYKTLYDFFNKNNIDDMYYNDFVNSLYKHTKDRPFDYYEDMKYRFMQQIKLVKTKRGI